jgi:hypothetical protein
MSANRMGSVEAVRNRQFELGWAVLIMIVNVILFASHAWALGSGLPSDASQEVIHCAYYDAKDQDQTPFATEKACHARHDHCAKACAVSAYSCVAQGVYANGKSCREAGFSEISEPDARSRAVVACLATGAANCQVLKCSEERREVAAL